MISLYQRRRFWNIFNLSMATLATLFGLFWLVWILWTTLSYGFSALHPALFTENTPPPGVDSGGLKNAFVGSLILIGLAVFIGAPLGILAGTWLGEFAVQRRLGFVVRFFNDILLSAPSIVIGLFVYAIIVHPLGQFSAISGAIALALIMIPVVVRTTDEMLQLVPATLREAAIALGVPYWRLITQITWRAAGAGILTGVLLATARISGETAPLLFTALNNQFYSTSLDRPIANLPVVIFQFAMSPYQNWQAMGWAGALIATLAVLTLSVVSRLIIKGIIKRGA
ncbi:MAG: phosphate ABC transporter permease PstA [Acidithiobacillus sp.]|nr:phosphate ABC transporter permease PstA [Acidithiobacillus sp.]